MFEQERAAIAARQRQHKEAIAGFEVKISEVDGELEGLFDQRKKYQLLNDVCQGLDQLDELGAGQLFWGEEAGSEAAKQRVARARTESAHFLEKISAIEARRASLQADIRRQEALIEDCHYELSELLVEEEQKLAELFVDRQISKLPYHAMVMPWDPEGEDAKRSRKLVFLMLFFAIMLGTGMMYWKLPPVDKYKPIEVPKRVVQLAKALPPPPPPKKEEKKEEEKKQEDKPEEVKKPTEKPTPVEVQQARAKAETKGVLAFKNSFSDLMEDDTSQLGADANIRSSAGNQAGGGGVGNGAAGSRSLIAAQGGAGSGGIANYGISRGGVGSGSGSAIAGGGMGVTRATSSLSDMKGDDRPLTKGAGPARTDEEIQIVFDKYKSALYRIYNRELRNDPTLRGKMVLAITIEPDGSVSACKVQSTDMNSPQLSADIVERVLKFNFGAKEGVPATKILYPIDFLPAS